MRIGVDISAISAGGVKTYVENLKKYLKSPKFEIIFLDCPKIPLLRILFLHFVYPFYALVKGIKLLHYTKSECPVVKTVKVITTLHDTIPLEHPRTENFLKRIYWNFHIKLALRKADKLICPSNYVKEKLKKYGVKSNRIKVVPHGTEFRKNDKSKILDFDYFLYVGRVAKRKGLKEALISFYEIAKERDIKFVICGKKDNAYREIVKLIKEKNLQDKVIFTGYVDYDSLDFLYQNALSLLYLTDDEGFGYPVLEALKNACPVIATPLPPFKEISQKILFCDKKNITDIISKMKEVLNNKNLRDEIKKEIEKLRQKFDVKREIEKTLKVYEEVLS